MKSPTLLRLRLPVALVKLMDVQLVKSKLVFETGKIFAGNCFTILQNCSGELVFNTAMSGYQEIITDPSYCGQMVCMTYPHIGNTGINPEDMEGKRPYMSAMLMKDYQPVPSNWRATESLKSYLDKNELVGISDLDTRAITRYVREQGAMRAVIVPATVSDEDAIAQAKKSEGVVGKDWVMTVTTKDHYVYPSVGEAKYRVAVLDCGVKTNILRQLAGLNCELFVYPANTPAQTVLDRNVDGVFISNGPGDPATLGYAIDFIKGVLGKKPLFGICLGHQLLGLAVGLKTYKLKFGHHGANHPIQNLFTGKIEITSQNHGFNVEEPTAQHGGISVTHRNLNDHTVAGIADVKNKAFSVQYHPEAAPGPHDSNYLFHDFIRLIEESR